MGLQAKLVWNFVRSSCSQSTRRPVVRIIFSFNLKLGIYIHEQKLLVNPLILVIAQKSAKDLWRAVVQQT